MAKVKPESGYNQAMGNFELNFGSRNSNRPPGFGAKIGGSLFLLIFLAFGVGFSYLIAREFLNTAGQQHWTKGDCVITQSAIVDNHKAADPKFTLEVAYTYMFGGKKWTGTIYREGYTGSSDYYETEKLADAFPVGSHLSCFVNPADPSHAILQQKSLAMGFFILLPLIFVLIGGGGIYVLWRSGGPGPIPKPNRTSNQTGSKGSLFFWSVFFLAGVLLLALWFIPTVYHIWRAGSWPQVPCTIVRSGVSSHSSDDGTTYAVEVFYRYRFNGREYNSSRYEFLTGSSSGYDGKQDIVNALLAHKKTVCYVNPADPEFAVLKRGYSLNLLFGLIPLLFAVFGAIGLVRIVTRGPTTGEVTDAAISGKPPSTMAKIFGGLFIAAFWNGIVSVFVMEAISSWQHHHPDYFLAVFLIPFVVVGVVLIGNFIYQIARALMF